MIDLDYIRSQLKPKPPEKHPVIMPEDLISEEVVSILAEFSNSSHVYKLFGPSPGYGPQRPWSLHFKCLKCGSSEILKCSKQRLLDYIKAVRAFRLDPVQTIRFANVHEAGFCQACLKVLGEENDIRRQFDNTKAQIEWEQAVAEQQRKEYERRWN